MKFISEGCIELTGYNPLDLIGNQKLSYGELIHPDDRGPVWDQIQEMLGEGRPFRVVYRIQTATGEQKWVGVNCYTTDDEQATEPEPYRPDSEAIKAFVESFRQFKFEKLLKAFAVNRI